ncbi:glycine betaine ABC transporter substrate-binding protein [Alicyclobacillus dauci]|uniref:ABC-type glycine betaine transport system substrate-binding domain-containing protein n=1 Tax=Alicyclobacillus dauci TaxID=1475485 RepID=A0ABY6Z384_9BACL|nr:glycine betaine ABC transporter substrate-binding protein [Alicyclobacillus dauci]WAH37078.1 hypothetical protein NZD86_00410 [Alicyclobacillus dauci]
MRKSVIALSMVSALGLIVSGCGTASQTANQSSNGTSTTGANGNDTQTTKTSGSKKISIAWLGWTEDVAVTHLWKDILESQGYQVNLTQMDLGPMFLGLSQNNTSIFLDAWLPSDNPYVNKYKSNLTSLGVWYTGDSNQGIAVPQYMNNINTMEDLNSHASEFQNRIVGIEPGSEEDNAVKKMISVYGMNNMSLQESSTTAMLSSLQHAYEQHQPIAVVMWTPHWAFVKYHLKFIKDPKKILAGQSSITIEANKEWAQSNPQVAKWFQNFKLNANQLASLEEAVKDQSDQDAAAKKWIQSNQALVNSWLK